MQRIKEEIEAILKQMTRWVMKSLGESLEYCLKNGGGHLSQLRFKT
jgi:hypothetical protein